MSYFKTGMAMDIKPGRRAGAPRGRVRHSRRGRRFAPHSQLVRPEAPGPPRRREATNETTPQRPTSPTRETPQGTQEGGEESSQEVTPNIRTFLH